MSAKERRHFDPITVPAEAGRRRVHRITCSRCPAFADVSANTHGGSRAHDDLFRVWGRSGWEIGSNPNRDLCPACASAKRRSAHKPKTEKPMGNKPAPLNAQVIPMPAVLAATPEAPRQPSFDEKRLINAKLEEIYLDDKRGYAPGWTDKRVAEDLGVPRKWIEDLREANFGPAQDNEEIRLAIEEAHTLRNDTQKALADARREVAAMRQRADQLEKLIPSLADRFADLDRKLGQIEKVLR
ncbi:hypothetical protein [Mesorhizobium sp. M2A.F.Ca.ET.039.01.1.1]|uniref:hypothetical protein n=1 Tax=Mesorhizobium sp. M2A.F.Ca.ET.039.01.1.1 TaxID=2496746 RepID=UPI000FCC72B2|nr:hypothetical protein [Mesorhizobium sp. M2A.F.Ca.ET.039.01.1.1]RWX72544.1 hypothetical protein EOA24_00700 [Mesorhizobium sp. M2A.F.Ca.ET.039.01.1.1]